MVRKSADKTLDVKKMFKIVWHKKRNVQDAVHVSNYVQNKPLLWKKMKKASL